MTPLPILRRVEELWGPITWDVFASPMSNVCRRLGRPDHQYFGPGHPDAANQDALSSEPWSPRMGKLAEPHVFANPEYGRAIGHFTQRVLEAVAEEKIKATILVFARTDTAWFRELILAPQITEAIFLKGRLVFLDAETGEPRCDPRTGKPLGAPCGSALLHYNPAKGWARCVPRWETDAEYEARRA